MEAMTDKDREAFEVWWVEKSLHLLMDKWQKDAARAGWKAAAAHYAPKLTEAEGVEKAARALAQIDHEVQADLQKAFGDAAGNVLPVNESWPGYIHEARAALRAAGAQFRDKPNPEPGSCQ